MFRNGRPSAGGDENFHVYGVNLEAGNVRDYSPSKAYALVKQAESEQIVSAIEKNHGNVTYVLTRMKATTLPARKTGGLQRPRRNLPCRLPERAGPSH